MEQQTFFHQCLACAKMKVWMPGNCLGRTHVSADVVWSYGISSRWNDRVEA